MARRDRGALLGGSAAIAAGAFFLLLSFGAPSSLSDGVPPAVGVAAGGVFLLAGVLVVRGSRPGGAADDLLNRVLAAVLVSLFATVAMVFPPGGIFVVFLAVLAWIEVYRKLHQRATGRDPLAGMSQQRHLGLGCLATIALALVAGLGVWLTSREPPPAAPLPEATDVEATDVEATGAGATPAAPGTPGSP